MQGLIEQVLQTYSQREPTATSQAAAAAAVAATPVGALLMQGRRAARSLSPRRPYGGRSGLLLAAA